MISNILVENSQTDATPPEILITEEIIILPRTFIEEKFHNIGYISPKIIANIVLIPIKFQINGSVNVRFFKNIDINPKIHTNVIEKV